MKVTWGKTLSVGWSLAWRGVVYGFLLGALLGVIAGFCAKLFGNPDYVPLYGAIGGWIATIPASILALRQALSAHLASLAAIAGSPAAK